MEQNQTHPQAESTKTEETKAKETAEKVEEKSSAEESSNLIDFDTFLSVRLRVAEILEAERIEKSAKLMKLQVSLGEELGKRQIVAGVAKHYQAEELVGKRIAVVANLKPAKLMGERSEGMLLAASSGDSLELLFLSDAIAPGASIS